MVFKKIASFSETEYIICDHSITTLTYTNVAMKLRCQRGMSQFFENVISVIFLIFMIYFAIIMTKYNIRYESHEKISFNS